VVLESAYPVCKTETMMDFSFKNTLASITNPNPGRDWSVALAILILLFVLLFAYAAYLFVGLRWGDLTGHAQIPQTQQPTVTRGKLESVLETYRARKANFEAGNFGPSGLFDPAE